MRIPIYTSKQPMQRPIVVEPSAGAGTEIAEAIGGLARTVGKVSTDWANKKAETEGQNDYVTNEIEDAKNQAKFFKDFQDDPNPRKDIGAEYKNYMQDKRKDYVWNRDFAKKKFTQTSQLSDVNAIQKLNNIDRHKFIDSIKTQGNINIASAIELGGLKGKTALEHSFVPLEKVYGKHELEELKIESRKAFSLSEASRALKLDPNADLSDKEFDNIKDEKAGLISSAKSAARAEANRLKQIDDDALEEEREKTEQSFFSKLLNNELTSPEIEASNLDARGKIYWNGKIGKDLKGAVVNDPATLSELDHRAEYKIGDHKKFLTDIIKAIEDKKIKNGTADKLILKWNKKEKDVGYDLADKIIYGDDVTLDFSVRDKLWIDFNEMRDAEPDKYKGRAAVELAYKMRDEEVEKNKSRFWDSWFFDAPISLLARKEEKPRARKPVAEEAVTDYSYLWKK